MVILKSSIKLLKQFVDKLQDLVPHSDTFNGYLSSLIDVSIAIPLNNVYQKQ